MSIEPLNLRFQVQHASLYTNLAIACKTETLSSLYSHALLILTKPSKSKHQVVHEQKFKDLLSNTCQVSVERSMLDLEAEVQWFNTYWGNILLLEFFCFHIVKPLMPKLALLPISFNYEKPQLHWHARDVAVALSKTSVTIFTKPSGNLRLLSMENVGSTPALLLLTDHLGNNDMS